ncbi:MAG: DUF2200 family protein [Myxococcales bacterium]|nr:DUF2200 family protein [Myxococcales bacterium]
MFFRTFGRNERQAADGGGVRLAVGAAAKSVVVCGVCVEEVDDPSMRKIRYLDKLIDELARWPRSRASESRTPRDAGRGVVRPTQVFHQGCRHLARIEAL